MIFGDKYVFLELGRTGSTYARYILKQIPNSKAVGKKHNIYNDLTKEQKAEFEIKNKIGTIRNPFEYYVSLFAFCCSERGGLHERITRKPDVLSFYTVTDIFKTIVLHFKYKKKWKKITSDENSTENFKEFLKMLFKTHPEAIGDYYGASKANNIMGFLSFNYLRTYTRHFEKDVKTIIHTDLLFEYDRKNNFIDIMFRNETLKQQLLENHQFYADSKEVIEKSISNRPPRSKTATEKKPFHLFYDDETRNLIYEMDRFIFEKYNYKFEDIIK